MRLRDAIDMLANADVDALGPTIWADLGCGDGTFTLALADRLASGSVVHAIDLDGSALVQRPDDEEATVRNRLAEQLPPLDDVVDHYREAGILASVDGRQTIDDVGRDVIRASDDELPVEA